MKKQVKPTWNGLDTFDVTIAGCLKRASLVGHKEVQKIASQNKKDDQSLTRPPSAASY